MQNLINKNHIFWILLTLAFLMLVVIFMGYFEIQRTFYASYEEAKKSGAFERGWLPEYLPISAKNIHEEHNLDTNQVWAEFEFDVEDIAKMESQCQLSEKNQNEQKFSCPEIDKTTVTFVLQLDGKGYYTSSYKH
jgi:hypothetical protein